MFYRTINLKEIYQKNFYAQSFHFDILQVGCGGNGGYLVQRLAKLLYALHKRNEFFSFSYTLLDGDIVEKDNLQRQPFIEEDINQPKAKVLAERYSSAYEIPIYYKSEYIEEAKDILDLFYAENQSYSVTIPILLGCVDNNATRQIMHEVFMNMHTILYIDSGIDSVDEEGSKESGYSGQVVCGLKVRNNLHLEPVGMVYPDILEDKDSRLPTQACGETVVYYPQRMQTNELAALVMTGYLNTLLSDHEIVSHYTNFNARTMLVRPTYIKKKEVESA